MSSLQPLQIEAINQIKADLQQGREAWVNLGHEHIFAAVYADQDGRLLWTKGGRVAGAQINPHSASPMVMEGHNMGDLGEWKLLTELWQASRVGNCYLDAGHFKYMSMHDYCLEHAKGIDQSLAYVLNRLDELQAA